MKILYLDKTLSNMKFALCEDNEMLELGLENELNIATLGNIYCGVIENIIVEMRASFVRFTQEKNGFLYMGDVLVAKEDIDHTKVSDIQKFLPGQKVMVQVVKEATGSKGARLTTNVTLTGKYCIFMPTINYIGVSKKIEDEAKKQHLTNLMSKVCPQGCGFVLRTASANVSDETIVDEGLKLIKQYQEIEQEYSQCNEPKLLYHEQNFFYKVARDLLDNSIDKIIISPNLYEGTIAETSRYGFPSEKIEIYNGKRDMFTHYQLLRQIYTLVDRKVPLKGGGFLIIETTEALTTIDINTGKFAKDNQAETIMATNLCACEEIAKQLRLRNIGGLVLCDFIDMVEMENRHKVLKKLEQCLSIDRLRTNITGMSGHCLVEITRKKTNGGIASALLETCHHCNGQGKILSKNCVSMKIRAALIDAFLQSEYDFALIKVSVTMFAFLLTNINIRNEFSRIFQDKKIFLTCDEGFLQKNFEISTFQNEEGLPQSAIRMVLNEKN